MSGLLAPWCWAWNLWLDALLGPDDGEDYTPIPEPLPPPELSYQYFAGRGMVAAVRQGNYVAFIDLDTPHGSQEQHLLEEGQRRNREHRKRREG
jgi:hypothetical protein